MTNKPPKVDKLEINQKIKFLKKIDFFENFDEHELRQLLDVTRWLRVKKDEYIIKENTMERVFYILIKGDVSVVKAVEGTNKQAVELTVLSSGACFGEMSLVMDVKRTAGVITRNECFLLLVEPEIINSSNVFLQLKFYKRFCEILVSRLIHANDRFANLDKNTDSQELKIIDLPDENKPHRSGHQAAKKVNKTAPESKAAAEDQKTVMILPKMPAKQDRIVKGRLQRRLSAALELPVNPVVRAYIRPLIINQSDNTRLFAEYIHLDPILSCKVLQTANSSFFRRTTPVSTVPHAMITVGINQIQESLSEIIEGTDSKAAFSGFSQVSSLFWRHSVIVARIAAMLTETIRIPTSADVYLAGLLHDLGILGLDRLEPNFYPHLLDKDSEVFNNFLESETSYIGVDHGQAGAWLGESIGMPEIYLDVMKMHHSPEKARSNGLIIALVHLADLFAAKHGCGFEYGHGDQIDIIRSFGWVIIQENHRPFLEVNIPDFIDTFNSELENTWSSLTDGLDF